jgi:DNA-directed RNA polymerase beta subunit
VPIQFKLFLKIEKGKPKVLCRVKHMKRDMPLGILLRALGLRSDEEIF